LSGFTDRLADFIAAPPAATAGQRDAALAALEDTFAVALAGWHDPVVTALRHLHGHGPMQLLDGQPVESAEHAALLHATAGHALDYDDVHLASTTHPSVVIAPALVAAASLAEPQVRSRMLDSYCVGVAVNVALGHAMGFEHYRRGWHATSTIGAIAAAAAVGHMYALSATQIRSALALAAAQAAGLQRNFGTMAKPVQAGFAAAAGLRAARMAQAGIDGDQDVFGAGGVLDIYSGGLRDDGPLELDPSSVSVKLYPCCYASHRMIAAAIDLRERYGASDDFDIVVRAPQGQLQPLRVETPRSGLEAKFCARYIVATALQRGDVGLADFTDEAVTNTARNGLMQRIRIEPTPSQPGDNLEAGEVVVALESGNAEARSRFYPGSPRLPPTSAQRNAKIADCLTVYARVREPLSIGEFRASIATLCAA